MSTNNKPERAWLCYDDNLQESYWWDTPNHGGTEYVRTDIVAEKEAEIERLRAENAELKRWAKWIIEEADKHSGIRWLGTRTKEMFAHLKEKS